MLAYINDDIAYRSNGYPMDEDIVQSVLILDEGKLDEVDIPAEDTAVLVSLDTAKARLSCFEFVRPQLGTDNARPAVKLSVAVERRVRVYTVTPSDGTAAGTVVLTSDTPTVLSTEVFHFEGGTGDLRVGIVPGFQAEATPDAQPATLDQQIDFGVDNNKLVITKTELQWKITVTSGHAAGTYVHGITDNY